MVERRVVVELKTSLTLHSVDVAQLLTYLQHSGCEVGLLINFHVNRLVDGIRRVIRTHNPSSASSSRSSAISAIIPQEPDQAET